jgi:hypothetical protein
MIILRIFLTFFVKTLIVKNDFPFFQKRFWFHSTLPLAPLEIAPIRSSPLIKKAVTIHHGFKYSQKTIIF